MNYASFCHAVHHAVSLSLENDAVVKKEKVLKNNGILLDALCITLPFSSCAPIIYLEPLFEQLQKGTSLEAITKAVLHCLREEVPVSDDLLDRLREPEAARAHIAYRLVSQASNKSLLEDVPWIPFLDLAIVFFLHLGSDANRQVGALIHNHQASLWNWSAGELLAIARENTPHLFPARIESLENVIAQIRPQTPLSGAGSSFPPALYLLTNHTGIHGASCMLYENVIEHFADQMESDILILPSSIHEVLLLACTKAPDCTIIQHMIHTINQEEVAPEEILSDELYIYSRSNHAIRIWPSGSHDIPEQAGTRNP